MTMTQTVHAAKPWIAIGGASAMAAAIFAMAPEVSVTVLGGMIVAWVALGIVRAIVLVGVARQIYRNLCAAHPA